MRARAVPGVAAIAVVAAWAAGCGGGTSPSGGAATNATSRASARPAYCTALSNLESSIKALPGTEVVKHGTSALEAAFAHVKQSAATVVEAAKGEFPTQTAALKSSVDTLAGTVEQLQHGASATLIAQLPGQVSAVVTSAKNLESAASSKCA